MPNSKPFDFDRAIARIPLWIAAVSVAGALGLFFRFGVRSSGGFVLGAIGAMVNFWIIERAVSRLAATGRAGGTTPKVFITFMALLLGVFAILFFSGFSLVAALCGFLVCPAAVLLELAYELITYEHT